jgi:nucleoside-diphosphate-sugar epimerase
MKKAIVTGANGFVGAAICRELSAQGVQIIAVVKNEDSDTSSIKNIPGLRLLYCDLSEYKSLTSLVPDRDIDSFYHLAWSGSSGPLRGNEDVQINNVRFTCDAVKACSDISCSRFIFASSIMEYEIEAIMETDVTPGINTLYCSAKVAADYIARTISGKLGIEYIRAVISNIYGPGEKSPRLINTSLRKLIRGEHCAFSTGEQMYDFIYITDAAKAFVQIGKKGMSNKTYYIGSQHPKPLKDFLIEMRNCVDPGIEIGLGEIPFSGVSLSYHEFDIDAVKRDTGFVPEVPFKEGILMTIKWLKEAG